MKHQINYVCHSTFLLLEVIKNAWLGFIKINYEIINLNDKTNSGLCFYTGKNTMKILIKKTEKITNRKVLQAIMVVHRNK